MAIDKDGLVASISKYMADQGSTQNIASQQTAVATQEHYLDKKDPGMARQTVKVATDLDKIIQKTNKKYKEAVDLQIKSLTVKRQFSSILESQVLDKEIKILAVMKEQYKVQERHVKLEALSNKMMGRTGTKMMKAAITGKNELGEEVGGRGKRAALAVGGAMVMALQGTYNGMLAGTMKFVTALKTAWDGGIAGVMQVAVGAITGMVSKIAPGLGAALGVIGELFIKIAMMRWEDQIARTTMGVRAAALGGGSGEKLFSDMLSVTKGIRALAVEWGNALVDVTTNTSTEVADTFYKFGRTYALTAQQTSEYMNKALVSGGEDAAKAGLNLTKVFEASKEMAKKSGINARFFTAAIMDAAVSARMFNVDIKSVANSMKDLSDNAGAMAGFGYSLRDNKQTITDLAQAPKNWSTSLHAFAGMKMFKDMKPTQAALASMYGETTARSIKQKEGGFGFTSKGEGGEAGLMQNRLKMMTNTISEATAGMPDPSDKYFTGLQMLSDLFGISGSAATAILAGVGQGKGEVLPDDVKNALLTEKQISEKLLTTSDRQEQIQRVIAGMVGRLVGLAVLLPDKIASFLPGTDSKQTQAGTAAFNTLKAELFNDLEGLTEYGATVFRPMQEGYQKAMNLKMKNLLGSKEGGIAYLKSLDEKIKEADEKIRYGKGLLAGTERHRGRLTSTMKTNINENVQQAAMDKEELLRESKSVGKYLHQTFNFHGYHDSDMMKVIEGKAAEATAGLGIN